MSTSLLGLPREIRDEIIINVVSSQIVHPPHPPRDRRKVIHWVDGGNMHHIFQPMSPTSYISPSRSLFMVNRQLREEAKDAVRRCDLVNTIRIAVINDTWVWPSWSFIFPRFETIMNRLDVEVFSAHEVSYTNPYPEYYPAEFFTLLAFLSSVYVMGPTNPTEPMPPDRNFMVKELCIKFNTGTHLPWPARYSEEDIPVRALQGMAHLDLSQLMPVDLKVAQRWFRHQSKRVDDIMHHPSSYGKWALPLLERTKKIVMSVDGKVQRIHDSRHC